MKPSTTLLNFPAAPPQRLELCLVSARRHEELGEFEAACEMIESRWRGPGHHPDLTGLSDAEAGELLTRAGSLTAGLGSKLQVEGWQERAKDLLTEAAARCESAQDVTRWGWAQKTLAVCYWREGSLSEARAIVGAATERVSPNEHELGISLTLVLALVECADGRNAEALAIHESLVHRLQQASPLTRGHHHYGLGVVREQMTDLDAALIETTAADYHYEQAGYVRGRILTLNNAASFCRQLRNLEAAHEYLGEAEKLAREINDDLHLAHLHDTRALVYLDEGRFADAETSAGKSVRIFERGDETAWLVRSLVTLARAQSRQTAGSGQDARAPSALQTYVRAYELAASKLGSRQAAEVALEMIGELAGEACLESHLTMDAACKAFEGAIIRRTLEETNGNISAAGLRLGESQQAMSFILGTRQKNLRALARQRPRRKSVMKKKS